MNSIATETPHPEAPLAAPVDDALLERVVRRITAEFPQACIVFFGSRAYGTPRPESDLDLLVIAPTEGGVFAAAGRVYSTLHPRKLAIDVVFMTPEQFRTRRRGFDPFLADVVARGRVLHGRLP